MHALRRGVGTVAFVAGWLLACAALAQDVPRDEKGFTEYVAAQLQKQLTDATVMVKGPLTLGMGELQVNLDRVYTFCAGNAQGCAAQIDNYVGGSAEAYRVQNAPPTAESVRLVLKSAQYVEAARSVPAGAKPLQIQSRPFVEGLYTIPVLDNPRTIRLMGETDNGKLGLSADQVFELGMANLKTDLGPLMAVAKTAAHGQIGQMTGSVFNPSRMILVDSWAPLAEAQGGVLILAVPATDAVFYIGEDTPKAIDALRTLAKSVMGQAPNRLSANLYRWRPSGWELVSK